MKSLQNERKITHHKHLQHKVDLIVCFCQISSGDVYLCYHLMLKFYCL